MENEVETAFSLDQLATPLQFDLTLTASKITQRVDTLTGKQLRAFPQALAKRDSYKLYVYKAGNEIQYVGVTKMSLATRYWYGSNKKFKYGYQFLHHAQLKLYVWTFPSLKQRQVENIEAELAYLIRNKTGRWPESQNEIHFNNDFALGSAVAAKLYEHLTA